MEPAPQPDLLRRQLEQTAALFADIRARFAESGVERGGHVRAGFTPIYARLAGVHAAQLFAGVDHHHVESSFNPEQLAHVQRALVVLRRAVLGSAEALSLEQRVVACYLTETQPAFVLALLRAIEGCVDDALIAHPEEAVVFDAIVRVAGGEGIRDLVCFFCAHLLEQAISSEESTFPDLTAFADVHERVAPDTQGRPETTRYEVWCPGTDLSKAVFAQARAAALCLVREHGVRFALSTREEAALLPARLPAYLTRRVQQRVDDLLRAHALVLG